MTAEVQVGWRSRITGEMCDCPVYESSPHANSEPVMVPREVAERIKTMHLPLWTTPSDTGVNADLSGRTES